jgi:hypothetical protein
MKTLNAITIARIAGLAAQARNWRLVAKCDKADQGMWAPLLTAIENGEILFDESGRVVKVQQ